MRLVKQILYCLVGAVFGIPLAANAQAPSTTLVTIGDTNDIYVCTRCGEDWLLSDYKNLRNVVTRQEVGIREVKQPFHFTLTPNPAKGVTIVQIVMQSSNLVGVLHVTVADLTGRDVLSRDIQCDGHCRVNLDIEGLPAGAYFVRIVGESGSAVRKLIVK